MPEKIKKKLEEEIKALEYELTNELPKEIKQAVAMGDLSENAEYHMAKQRQVYVNARLGQLKKRMGELAMVNMANIPKDKVAAPARREEGRKYRVTGFLDPDPPEKLFRELLSKDKRK